MSRRIEDHLSPAPARSEEVTDSDGVVVRVGNPKRITNYNTAVNIGTSPNANDGDPLRTAFIKINNFIEAAYWASQQSDQFATQLSLQGPFMGVLTHDLLPTNANGLWIGEVPSSLDVRIAVLAETLDVTDTADYQKIYRTNLDVPLNNGKRILRKGSLLKYNAARDQYDIVYQNEAANQNFNYDVAVQKLQNATQDTSLDSDSQIDLFAGLNELPTTTKLHARTVEDAIVELNARLSRRGTDAGYYG